MAELCIKNLKSGSSYVHWNGTPNKITFGRAFVTKLDGTVIKRINLNNLAVLPTSAPSSPVEGEVWIE